MIEVVYKLNAYDPVSSELMATQLSNLISIQSIITHADGSDEFKSISVINSKRQDIITPEELSSCLCIGPKTDDLTIKATTRQYTCTTGFPTKRFRTDKSNLRCNQLSGQYGTFYTAFLKVQVTSLCGYCGLLLYTNNIGFKKFFPC